jgi:hypothetical protein
MTSKVQDALPGRSRRGVEVDEEAVSFVGKPELSEELLFVDQGDEFDRLLDSEGKKTSSYFGIPGNGGSTGVVLPQP